MNDAITALQAAQIYLDQAQANGELTPVGATDEGVVLFEYTDTSNE